MVDRESSIAQSSSNQLSRSQPTPYSVNNFSTVSSIQTGVLFQIFWYGLGPRLWPKTYCNPCCLTLLLSFQSPCREIPRILAPRLTESCPWFTWVSTLFLVSTRFSML